MLNTYITEVDWLLGYGYMTFMVMYVCNVQLNRCLICEGVAAGIFEYLVSHGWAWLYDFIYGSK